MKNELVEARNRIQSLAMQCGSTQKKQGPFHPCMWNLDDCSSFFGGSAHPDRVVLGPLRRCGSI